MYNKEKALAYQQIAKQSIQSIETVTFDNLVEEEKIDSVSVTTDDTERSTLLFKKPQTFFRNVCFTSFKRACEHYMYHEAMLLHYLKRELCECAAKCIE